MYNWGEIKGQSLWINVTLEEQGEINNQTPFYSIYETSAE